MDGGDDGRPPPTVLERQRVMEEQMAALAAAVEVLAVERSERASAAPQARPSLPVRAATGGYRLTKGAAMVLGVLLAVGECAARRAGVDATPLRQAVDAVLERVPPPPAPPSSAP